MLDIIRTPLVKVTRFVNRGGALASQVLDARLKKDIPAVARDFVEFARSSDHVAPSALRAGAA